MIGERVNFSKRVNIPERSGVGTYTKGLQRSPETKLRVSSMFTFCPQGHREEVVGREGCAV